MNYKSIFSILCCSLALLLSAACSKDDDDENQKKTVAMGTDTAPSWQITTRTYTEVTEAPVWEITSDVDKSSSMTITCAITTNGDVATVNSDDYVAAFLNDVCVGEANPTAVMGHGFEFFLYINGILDQNLSSQNVVIKYFSSQYNRVYTWTLSDVTYTKDAIIGTYDQPYSLDLGSASNSITSTSFCLQLPAAMTDSISSKDEVAIFVGDECRNIRSSTLIVLNTQSLYQLNTAIVKMFEQIGLKEGKYYVIGSLPIKSKDEKIQIKYYCDKLSRIFTFTPFAWDKYGDEDIIDADELGFE